MRAIDRQELLGGRQFADQIFVLTPKGDVVELPEGATPLDFAFQVHTDIGLNFRAARVNGDIAPMNYTLENGDVVEIVKGGQPQASPRWLKLLKTASARSRLKRYLAEKHVLNRDVTEPVAIAVAPRKRLTQGNRAPAVSPVMFTTTGRGIDVPMPLKPALCCKPERGERVGLVGIITRAGVIRVHRATCKLIRQVNQARRVEVAWGR